MTISTRVAAVSLVMGCSGPASVRIVEGTDIVDVPRGSLVDLDEVRGSDVTFWVGSRVDMAPVSTLPRDGGLDAEDFVWGEDVPRSSWMTSGDTAIPTDFDTLAMFTAFVHLEQVLGAYAALGVREEALADLAVHYDPYDVPEGNAAYLLPADVMLLVRPASFEELPMSMNLGILAHELGHRVNTWELWDGHPYGSIGAAPQTVGTLVAYRHLAAVDEGIADYFGAVISGDPSFLAVSVPIVVDRALDEPKEMDPAWATSAPYLPDVVNPDPHAEGAVLAAALWAVGEELGQDVVTTAVLDAQRSVAGRVQALDRKSVV